MNCLTDYELLQATVTVIVVGFAAGSLFALLTGWLFQSWIKWRG